MELIIKGERGEGKTTLAIIIVKALLAFGYDTKMFMDSDVDIERISKGEVPDKINDPVKRKVNILVQNVDSTVKN